MTLPFMNIYESTVLSEANMTDLLAVPTSPHAPGVSHHERISLSHFGISYACIDSHLQPPRHWTCLVPATTARPTIRYANPIQRRPRASDYQSPRTNHQKYRLLIPVASGTSASIEERLSPACWATGTAHSSSPASFLWPPLRVWTAHFESYTSPSPLALSTATRSHRRSTCSAP
jgi:hypothetical protein